MSAQPCVAWIHTVLPDWSRVHHVPLAPISLLTAAFGASLVRLTSDLSMLSLHIAQVHTACSLFTPKHHKTTYNAVFPRVMKGHNNWWKWRCCYCCSTLIKSEWSWCNSVNNGGLVNTVNSNRHNSLIFNCRLYSKNQM